MGTNNGFGGGANTNGGFGFGGMNKQGGMNNQVGICIVGFACKKFCFIT